VLILTATKYSRRTYTQGPSGGSATSQCLQELRISSCPGFGRLQSLPRTIPTLTSLTLSACQVSWQYNFLRKMGTMTTAYGTSFRLCITFACFHTQALSNDDLGTLIDGFPALRYLCLDDCHAITGKARRFCRYKTQYSTVLDKLHSDK
jgi:hypothetical protein